MRFLLFLLFTFPVFLFSEPFDCKIPNIEADQVVCSNTISFTFKSSNDCTIIAKKVILNGSLISTNETSCISNQWSSKIVVILNDKNANYLIYWKIK